MENQSKPKKAVKRKSPHINQTKSEHELKNVKLTHPLKSTLGQKSKSIKKKSRAVKFHPLDIKLHNKITSTAPRSPSPVRLNNKIQETNTKDIEAKHPTIKKIMSHRSTTTTHRSRSPVKLNNKIQEKKPKESEEIYPIFNNKELIDAFMKVPLNNNQKGRIRQALKTQLQGSNDHLYPDIINGKILSIMKNSPLNESDLRRIRILYNMLKTSLEKEQVSPEKVKKIKTKKTKKIKDSPKIEGEEKELQKKVKGPRRYVVFLGNLPLDITKDKIMNHFSELNEHIKDIRLQKPTNGKKSSFAYVELGNEPSYELALSKHHSMLGTRRINVLYTTQKNGKISKAEAKSKSAKLIALQKSGKLIGSVPITKKRSHRRMILKKARAKEEAMKT